MVKKTTRRPKIQPDPPLDENDLLKSTDQKVFDRGEDYFENGAIVRPTRIGKTLTARCRGSDYQPYRVKVVFSKKKVTEALCTCPYEFGGYCKHIVALLLTHIRAPEVIEIKPTVEEALVDREHDELVAIVTQAVEYNPDLYGLIDGSGLPEDDEDESAEDW
jgi:uncharacterized Zn finger protein